MLNLKRLCSQRRLANTLVILRIDLEEPDANPTQNVQEQEILPTIG